MLEQQGITVVFYAFFVASKVGKTGLTVTVDVRNPSDTLVVTGGSAVEVGGGLYKYSLSGGSIAADGEWTAVFKTSDATVDAQHVPSLWVIGRAGIEHLDADVADVPDVVWDEALAGHATSGTAGKALSDAGGAADPLVNAVPGSYVAGTAGYALGLVGTGQFTVVSPVANDGNSIELVRGDSYANADGRALSWLAPTAGWPDLTAAVVKLTLRQTGNDRQDLQVTGTVVTPTGAGAKVRFELTAAQTTGLIIGPSAYKFDVQAALQISGNIVTLALGMATILEDETR